MPSVLRDPNLRLVSLKTLAEHIMRNESARLPTTQPASPPPSPEKTCGVPLARRASC